MIVFVSGRCDIPAFFSNWFFHRLQEGFVDVRNPYNKHQISRIILQDEYIDCILFCTKNPIPMLDRLDEIRLPYLFHITLTPYHSDIEKHVGNKKDILEAIQILSMKIGKKRVVVRYDPILLTPVYTIGYHIQAFERLCCSIQGAVETVIISFVDMYKNTKHNVEKMKLIKVREGDIRQLAKEFGRIAQEQGILLQTCAEDIDLTQYHIRKGLCIDQGEIESIVGHQIEKGKGVRGACACMESVDIGDYNCCMHKCLYCYANYDEAQIAKNDEMHDVNSSVLIGRISDEDTIHVRGKKRVKQMKLF